MTTVDKTPEANEIATIVADRCHGKRKPGSAPERYAIIWQAARLGALEAMKREPFAGIENPAAFREAARGMMEALEGLDTAVSADDAIVVSYDTDNALAACYTALTAFRAQIGEA